MTQVDSLTFALPCPNLLRARAIAKHFDPHLHDTYSVVALTRGAATITSERWSSQVRAGDIFFFNPFEVHSGRSDQQPAEYEVLYPSSDFLNACIGRSAGEEVAIRTGVLARCRESMELIDVLSAPIADITSVEVSVRNVLSLCGFASASQAPQDQSIAQLACSIIGEDCTRPIRTEVLARRIGVHKSHLIRVFSATMGISPQTYVRQIRVSRARELICAGRELSDVANLLGFCDQAHLSREFKKVFGVAPGRLSRGLARGERPVDANPVQ